MGEAVLDRMTEVFVEAVSASYALCDTTDDGQRADSATFRGNLIANLQFLGRTGVVSGRDPNLSFNVDRVNADFLRCRYEFTLDPEFTRLFYEGESAVVTLVGNVDNPVSGELMPLTSGMTFEQLGSYQIESSDNVSLGIISGDTLTFVVSDDEEGEVTLSGGLVETATSAYAQLMPRFAGTYNLGYSGTVFNCTDPEDEGEGSDSFPITLSATVVSVINDRSLHDLDGSENGLTLDLQLTEWTDNALGNVTGRGYYHEVEYEEVFIDDEWVECRYETNSSANLDGSVSILSDSVKIDLSPSNLSSTWTGSPAICGNGSCSVDVSIELTKSGEP